MRPAIQTPCLSGSTAPDHLFNWMQSKQEEPPQEPPEVAVTEVVQRNVPIYREWVAQLNGRYNAQITPRVQGYLLTQNYRDGFFVKKGQLLYQVDPHAFEVAIAQAKAQVAVAVANLSNADTNVARDRPLAAQSAIPQKQLDTDIATQAASQAQLDAAKAQLAQAELNLSWTKVYSPIDGIAGISTAQIGNLVGTTTIMTTVSQVNPIWAYFNISEADYLSRAEMFYQLISGKRVASPVLDFIQADGTTYSQEGQDRSGQPGSDRPDRNHPIGRRVSQSRRDSSSGRLRPRTVPGGNERKCHVSAAAGRDRDSIDVYGGRGRARQ